ncbi:MAG TPA: response regulator [Pyrinomonadaceae bacterium]|nr:response regulator [Pyrinomonadaceae bacterium]
MVGQQGHTDRPAEAIRVLVVDDYPDTAETTKRLLQLKGHAVRTAVSGREAIREFSAFAPELVLLDIAMPDMDGIEVAKAIHATEGIEKPVIAAMSGYSSLVQKRRCASAGFDYYLLKPVDPIAIDQLLWLERNQISNTFLALEQQQWEIKFQMLRSQLEYGWIMLDVATTSKNEATKKRCTGRARQLLERTSTLLAGETNLLPGQISTLEISLSKLAVRLRAAESDASA